MEGDGLQENMEVRHIVSVRALHLTRKIPVQSRTEGLSLQKSPEAVHSISKVGGVLVLYWFWQVSAYLHLGTWEGNGAHQLFVLE